MVKSQGFGYARAYPRVHDQTLKVKLCRRYDQSMQPTVCPAAKLRRPLALLNAVEVLSGKLAWRLAQAKAVPAPSQKIKGAFNITPDAKT